MKHTSHFKVNLTIDIQLFRNLGSDVLHRYNLFSQTSTKKLVTILDTHLRKVKGQRNNDCLQMVLIIINISTLNGGKRTSRTVEEQNWSVWTYLTFPATLSWSLLINVPFYVLAIEYAARKYSFEQERRGANIGRTNKKRTRFELVTANDPPMLVSLHRLQLHEITRRCECKHFHKKIITRVKFITLI